MDGRIAEQRGWCVRSFKSEASHSQTPRGTLTSFFCLTEFFGDAQRTSPKGGTVRTLQQQQQQQQQQ